MAWPKGAKRPNGAGRKKGTPNKATAARAKAIADSGLTPLDFMLVTMRDEARPFHVRLDAAKSAAPYVHPKLAAVEHKGRLDINLTESEVDADIARLQAEIAGAVSAEGGDAEDGG